LFSRAAAKIVDLQKRRKEVNQDILTYIGQKLEESSKFRSWPLNIKGEVKSVLMQKANGM
jgi:hypothetical protein